MTEISLPTVEPIEQTALVSQLAEDTTTVTQPETITLQRSTLAYMLFALFLILCAYGIGWIMGLTSRETTGAIQAAVREAAATSIAAANVVQPASFVQLSNQHMNVTVGDSPTLGPADAQITMLAYSDFQCLACKQFHDQVLPELLKKYAGKLRFVHRDFPIRALHPYAQTAAEAGQCAHEQQKFWEYHDLLFQNPQRLTKADLLSYANQLKLDVTTFQNCLDTGKYAQRVQDTYRSGVVLGVGGTPTFFINGLMVTGAQTLEEFSVIIDGALKRQR